MRDQSHTPIRQQVLHSAQLPETVAFFLLLTILTCGATAWKAANDSADAPLPNSQRLDGPGQPAPAVIRSNPTPAAPATPTLLPGATNAMLVGTMPVNQAVMVTVELEFGTNLPTIAEALKNIERRSQPDDGRGRTFAILDAYGNPTPDGKKLHISMHVSSEKTGLAALIFRPTGRELWKSRIVNDTNASTFTGKNLTILLDDGAGKSYMVDGSANPASLMDAPLRDTPTHIREFWPDGAEREVTFIYSACGCPVKAKVRRVGERTMRTQDTPVMFPDDPAVLVVISRVMGW